MAPHLERWDSELREQGLRVVEVEYGGATERAELERHLAAKRPAYPVLYDADGALAERFAVRGFPTAFLVDRNGLVVWHGYPAQAPAAVDAAIRRALAR